MTSTAHDRFVAVAPASPRALSASQMSTQPDHRRPETSSTVLGGGSAVPPLATESRAPVDHHDKSQIQQQQQQHQSQLMSVDDRFSQSDPRSADGSQASNATTASDQVFTPTASDDATVPPSTDPTQDSQLLKLSALAAAQDRMETEGDEYGAGTRKRMADGVVKSPTKGHSRNTSAISMASTTSTIGELSSDLRTRLSYAMVKVNNGWQAHSLDEVESLASQAVSPTSSTSTAHRRNRSSVSPQMRAMPQVHFANDPVTQRRNSNSNSPPNINSNRPTLAPPAPIRPAVSVGASSTNPRRNSNPPYTPTLLSHSQSASPRTPGHPPMINTSQARLAPGADASLYSPHQNVREVREQDAIESLLFMSSPNNSANMKHTFSPNGSPGPTSQPTPRTAGRQALPSGARKALPNQRPAGEGRRPGYEMSPGAHPPHSRMDLDSPQQMSSGATRGMPRRRTDAGAHSRSALSLPSALGISHVRDRKPITDKDIDSMLDRAGDGNVSSDDEDIPLPPRRNGVAGAIRA